MTRHRVVLSLLLVASTAIAPEAGAAEIDRSSFPMPMLMPIEPS